jgi:hypothetical protein
MPRRRRYNIMYCVQHHCHQQLCTVLSAVSSRRALVRNPHGWRIEKIRHVSSLWRARQFTAFLVGYCNVQRGRTKLTIAIHVKREKNAQQQRTGSLTTDVIITCCAKARFDFGIVLRRPFSRYLAFVDWLGSNAWHLRRLWNGKNYTKAFV